MNAQQKSETRTNAAAGAWSRSALTAAVLAATLGTGVLVGATAFGSDAANAPSGPSAPGNPPAAHRTTVDPLVSCFGSYRAVYRWLQHGGGDPQQCFIARSAATDGSAPD